MQANETDAARRELETLQGQDPPSDVKSVLDEYLAVIDRYHGAYRTTFSRYVQAGVGIDTNVNNATDRGAVAAPGLGGLIFAFMPDSRELDSAVVNLGAGFSFSAPVRDALRVVGGMDFEYDLALKDSDFTKSSAKGHTGLQYTRGNNQISLIAQGEKFFIDGTGQRNADRELAGGILQLRHALNQNMQLSLFGQFATVRYPEQQVRNVNRSAGGGGFAYAMPDVAGSPVLFMSGFGGNENTKNNQSGLGGGKHFGRDFFGFRAGGQRQLGARGSVFANVTYQSSDYNAADPVFGTKRDDDYIDVVVGYNFRYDSHWVVTPRVTYANNDSNIVVNDYDRVEFMVVVRNGF